MRMRVEPVLKGLNSIEIATETVTAGSVFRTRIAAILRCEPGSAAARQLATSPYAAEHHLTPDLREELVVLRDRRGRSGSGITPLRAALARLSL